MLGRRIAFLRKNTGIKQEVLAKELLISRTSISAYERETKKPNYETIVRIADYFNVTTDYLIRGRAYIDNVSEEEILFCILEKLAEIKKEIKSYLEHRKC